MSNAYLSHTQQSISAPVPLKVVLLNHRTGKAWYNSRFQKLKKRGSTA